MKWLSIAAFFVGSASLILMAFPGRRVSKKRLGIEREKVSLSQSMDDFLDRRGKRQALAHALNLAGIETEPGLFALRVVLATVVMVILGLLVGPVFALIGLVAPVIVAHMVVKSKGRKRQEAFAAQLPDVLQLLISFTAVRTQPAAGLRLGGPRGGRTGSFGVRPHVGRDPFRCGVSHCHASYRPTDGFG